MNFADKILVRLGDEGLRSNLFSAEALESMATAAYRMEPGQLSAPWSARFDALDLAPSHEQALAANAEVHWEPMAQRGSAQFSSVGMATYPNPLLPLAYWGGAIIGQGRLGGGRIAQVSGNFVSLAGIDEAIDAAAGAGSEPQGAARETARLTEISSRLSLAAGKPGSIGPELVKQWLEEKAEGDLDTLFASASMVELPGGFRIKYESDAPAQDLPMALGVDAVVFAFDVAQTPVLIADALRSTMQAQEQAALERQPAQGVGGIDRRVPVLGVWVVPHTWFNDADWPGANPSERRKRANQWLQSKGIAIVLGSGP